MESVRFVQGHEIDVGLDKGMSEGRKGGGGRWPSLVRIAVLGGFGRKRLSLHGMSWPGRRAIRRHVPVAGTENGATEGMKACQASMGKARGKQDWKRTKSKEDRLTSSFLTVIFRVAVERK